MNARRLWEASGKWNLIEEKNRRSPFAINPNEFSELLAQREELDNRLEEFTSLLNLQILKLYYEDLLIEEDLVINKVFNFLGVAKQPTKGKTIKHTQDDLQKVITNFGELRSHFAGTKYLSMFDEIKIHS